MNIYQDLPAFPQEHKPLRPSKAKRLRVVWFILGIGAGILLTRTVEAALDYSMEIAQEFGSVNALQTVFIDKFRKDEVVSPPLAVKNSIVAEPESVAGVTTTVSADTTTADSTASSATTVATTPSPRPSYPRQLSLTVNKGDTLLDMLNDSGIVQGEPYRIIQALKPVYDPRRLKLSHKFSLTVDKDKNGELIARKLDITISPLRKIALRRDKNGHFKASKEVAKLVKKTAHAGGTITNSLYQTARDNGIPENLVAEIIKAYSYDVDFQRDVKRGDAIDVLFEQMQTDEGKVITGNKVLHATLTTGGRKIAIYRYTDSKGNSGYYNARGESVRKALLRTPINGARISSGFGKRRHPVLGYTKMHKGIDFAASRGTPVYAAGDGVVERANRYGSYGNYVRIRHNGKYSTAYAHLSRFGKGIRSGRRVKQGQVIGYVGTTGRSTGPHLHYEVLAYNRQINPSGMKFKTGRTLRGKELARFKAHAQALDSQTASLPRIHTEVAAINR